MKDDLAYIDHILLSISRINNYTEGLSRSDFENNEMVQDAVIRNIDIPYLNTLLKKIEF